jgi:hypothetical protein
VDNATDDGDLWITRGQAAQLMGRRITELDSATKRHVRARPIGQGGYLAYEYNKGDIVRYLSAQEGTAVGESEEFFTFDDVCKRLSIDEKKLKRLVSEGEIRAFRDRRMPVGTDLAVCGLFRGSDVENLDVTGSRGEEETGIIDLSKHGDESSEMLSDDLIFDEGDDLDLTAVEAGLATAHAPKAEQPPELTRRRSVSLLKRHRRRHKTFWQRAKQAHKAKIAKQRKKDRRLALAIWICNLLLIAGAVKVYFFPHLFE